MRTKRNGGANGDLQVIEFICRQSGPQIAHIPCSSGIQMATWNNKLEQNIMRIKKSKKLSLAKETLKILNAGDLARVQGAYTVLGTSLSIEYLFESTSSNSL